MYFWAGICWWGKTRGIAWTAADAKVCFRHTKNLCVGTLFADEGVVYRVLETRSQVDDDNVTYCDHFPFPDGPPENEHDMFVSTHDDVKD